MRFNKRKNETRAEYTSAEYYNADEENRSKCLNCDKEECDDCLTHKEQKYYENVKLMQRIIQEIKNCLDTVFVQKHKEYGSKTDYFHNFTEAGKWQECSDVKALAGMMSKHIVSIYDMINAYDAKETLPTKEIVDEKIGDAINYLILLKGLFLSKIPRKRGRKK